MPTLFSVIKQNEKQKTKKYEEELDRDRALKRNKKEKERKEIEEVLLSTKDAFFDATSKLENLIKGIKENLPTEHVNSLLRLIEQSKLIVNSSTDFKTNDRVKELTRIVTWADNTLNNKIFIAEEHWELLSNEMKKESFFDKKSNRVVGGICLAIIAAVAALVLAPYLWNFGILALNAVGMSLDFLGVLSVEASVAIFVSAVFCGIFSVHDVIYGRPESVGCEVRELTNFFEAPKLPVSENAHQQELKQRATLNI